MFSSLVKEFGNDLARHAFLLARQVQRQMSLAATEQHPRLDTTALTLRRLRDIVFRNQDVIRVSATEHFYTHQPRRNHDRMATIHPDRIDRLQPSNALTSRVAEGHVPPDLLDRTSRLHTTKHRTFRQCLILERHFGLTQDSYLLEPTLDPASFPPRCQARRRDAFLSRARLFRTRLHSTLLCLRLTIHYSPAVAMPPIATHGIQPCDQLP